MGKAYNEEQRQAVKLGLEAGKDEETIERETGVSDRTIRRWKMELERTGRIGKPPEARTGRHRVLSVEIEAALFEHTKDKPEMTVDDMLWWLYDTYKIVVGTRTIRRVFERKGDNVRGRGKGKAQGKGARQKGAAAQDEDDEEEEEDDESSLMQTHAQYQSPYAPIVVQQANAAEQQLANALQQPQHLPNTRLSPQQQQQQFSNTMDTQDELPEDEETIQLQLQQIALQKREVELRLKMRQIQSGKGMSASARKTPGRTSTLYDPNATPATAPKRDSRSKKKIEESKRRTAERQERMLADLERRSRRRDHLTAEWVQSKDIWPLRAQGILADLMHQYSCYAYSQAVCDTFEQIYRELYRLVDLAKGDWIPQVHDELLRERMKRKMGQLRAKMQKSGEIVGRTDGYSGFTKAENYTGEQAGQTLGDENEMVSDMQAHADMQSHPDMRSHADMQSQPGATQMQDEHMHYEPVPDHQQMGTDKQMPDYQQMQASNMPYAHAMMGNPDLGQGPSTYPMIDHSHPGMLPYGSMNGQSGVLM